MIKEKFLDFLIKLKELQYNKAGNNTNLFSIIEFKLKIFKGARIDEKRILFHLSPSPSMLSLEAFEKVKNLCDEHEIDVFYEARGGSFIFESKFKI